MSLSNLAFGASTKKNVDTLNKLINTTNVTGENLVINPNFKLNSWGEAQYCDGDATITHSVDGWAFTKYASDTLDVIDDGVRLTSTSKEFAPYIRQYIKSEQILGNTIAISIKIGAYTLSGEQTVPGFFRMVDGSDTEKYTIDFENVEQGGTVTATFNISADAGIEKIDIGCYGGCSLEVQWIKLELGEFSTNFIDPNPETELERVRQYYYKNPLKEGWHDSSDNKMTLKDILTNSKYPYPYNVRINSSTAPEGDISGLYIPDIGLHGKTTDDCWWDIYYSPDAINDTNCTLIAYSVEGTRIKIGEGEWQNIADRGDADTIDGLHASDIQIDAVSDTAGIVTLDGLQGGVPFSMIEISGKNLCDYPYYSGSNSVSAGVEFAANDDCSVTANGTATGAIGAYTIWGVASNKILPAGTYTVSGCPKHDGNNKYQIIVAAAAGGRLATDTGDGAVFTLTEPTQIVMKIYILTGKTADNVVFYPQLERGDTATEYEEPIIGQDITLSACGKNLIPYPYYHSSMNVNGVTISDNGDGSITVNGAATDNVVFYFAVRTTGKMNLPNGEYFVSGCPKNSDLRIDVSYTNDSGTASELARDSGNGAGFTMPYSAPLSVGLVIFSGKTYDHITVRPQLERGDNATEYELYSGSTITVTPDSNPYTVQEIIRQQDDINTVYVSAGEITVSGVRKSPAINRAWEEIDNKANLSDIPTSLPADGGNADTLGGYYPKDIFKFIGNKNTKNDCNDCSETGFYFFNGCGANAPNTGGTVSSGTYFVLENLSYNDSYFKQTAMFVHGASNLLGRIFNRYCNNGEWSEWVEINGNADTLDGKHAIDVMNMENFATNRTSISENTDLNTVVTGGKYLVGSSISATITNSAFSTSGYHLDVLYTSSSNIVQRAISWNGWIKSRMFNGTSWGSWVNTNDGGNAATVNSHTVESNVPADAKFTDTVYTHPSYTARTGVPTANQTPAFGGTFTVSQPISDAKGHITAINSRTITVPSTVASTSANGLMSSTDKTKLNNLVNPITVTLGNTSGTTSADGGYYKAFTLKTAQWGTYDILMLVSSANHTNNSFDSYLINIRIWVNSSSVSSVNIICPYNVAAFKTHFDKLYLVYDPSSITTDMEIWYNNPAAYSEISLKILAIQRRGDKTNCYSNVTVNSTPNTSTTGFTSGLTAKSFTELEIAPYHSHRVGPNVDDLTSSGIYVVYGTDETPVTNGPGAGNTHMFIQVYVHDSKWIRQVAYDARSNTTWSRAKLNGSWGEWNNIADGGAANTAKTLATARTVDGVSFNGSANITHYGTCSTAAATAEKVVSLTGFTLATGARIAVKFTVTNTAASPTLNVNSTGAKEIYYRGAAISAGYLAANRTYEFVYNGTQYDLIGDLDTNTDTKVTAVGNHYTPSGGTTTSASGGTLTDITNSSSGVQVLTGVTKDAAGHVTGVTSVALKSTNTNSDTMVAQNNSVTNADYRLLLSASPDDNTKAEQARKSAKFTANPSTGVLTATTFSGNLSGNVNGKNINWNIYSDPTQFGKAVTDTATDIWTSLPSQSMFIIETKLLTDSSWNFPSDENATLHTLVMMKDTSARPAGIYLYPKTSGNIYYALVDNDGNFVSTWYKINDGGNADTVDTNAVNPGTAKWYYPTLVDSNNSSATAETIRTNQYTALYLLAGTTESTGVVKLGLGNNLGSGVANNAKGQILLHSEGTGALTINPATTNTNCTLTLPAASGTLALNTVASASANGLVSTGAQTFAGNKTFNGQVLPSGASDVTVAQARKIYAGTTDLTAGTSSLETGAIYLVYE